MSAQLLVREPDGSVVERAPEDLSELRDRPAWLDLAAPGEKELALVAEELGLHPLAIEDAVHRHQRPKIEQYEGHSFLVAYAVERTGRGILRYHEVSVFLVRGALVTVRDADFPGRAGVEKRWREGRIPSTGRLLHALLDVVVDGYFPLADDLTERVDALEAVAVAGTRGAQRAEAGARQLFRVKRELIRFRLHIAPQRDVLSVLVRDEQKYFEPGDRLFLQDVYDHVVRLTDQIDIAREVATSAIDAYLVATSNRLNEVLKVLTAIATVLLVVTVITGFFGMNFSALPFDSPIALWSAVAAMIVASVGLVLYFRRLGWL